MRVKDGAFFRCGRYEHILNCHQYNFVSKSFRLLAHLAVAALSPSTQFPAGKQFAELLVVKQALRRNLFGAANKADSLIYSGYGKRSPNDKHLTKAHYLYRR